MSSSPGKLTNVHEALQKAVLSSARPNPRVTGSYRTSAVAKTKAEGICATHGTTLSEFLNACVEGLVDDYQNPQLGQ